MSDEKAITSPEKERQIVLNHITVKEATILNSALKGAGLAIDLTSTAVVYELVLEFLKKKGDITLKDISEIVEAILSNPDFVPKQIEK